MPKSPGKTKSPRKTAGRFRIKRVYEPAGKDDGLRVLVDRLWPRGIAKRKAHIDLWLRDLSPSDALRRMVHADPTKWDEFVKAYGPASSNRSRRGRCLRTYASCRAAGR